MTVYTDEIEKNANLFLEQTLQDLFIKANFKLRTQENFKEKGIDFTIEIESRDPIPVTLGFFSLQNKGSEGRINILKNGLISFKLEDIRHIDYWCRQLDRPFIFTLCDLETKTIYWKALQLEADHYLVKAEEVTKAYVEGERKNKSIQLYLDTKQTLINNGTICHEAFNEFYSQIEESRKYISQQSAYKLNYERIDKFAEIIVDRSLHILDQLHNYLKKRFQYIKVLPHGFWALSYPLKAGNSAYYEYDLFCLYTDNSELFEIFDTFSINEDWTIQITNSNFYIGVKKPIEKLQYILRVLNQNLVFNIALKSKNIKKAIRLVEPDVDEEIDYCFSNLRFDIVRQRVKKKPSNEKELEQLAFLQYEIGNYNQAARLYLQLIKSPRNIHNSPKNFIYAYNLSKLESFVRYRFSNEKQDNDLLNNLKVVKVNFENLHLLFDNDARITKWLKQRLFFWEYQSDIQENVEKLRDFHYSLLNGGLGSNSLIWNIYVQHAMLLSFMDANKIVCDFQSDYNQLNEKVAESFFISYSIDTNMASRLETFDDWHLKFMILFCKGESLQKYIRRYHIQSLKYARNTLGHDGFMDLARNFFNSASTMTTTEGWEDSWSFNDKYRDILGNLLVLGTYLELVQEEEIELARLIREFLNLPLTINYPLELKFINQFLVKKGSRLGEDIFKDYFSLFFQSPRFHKEDFLYSLFRISEETGFLIDSNEQEIDKLLTILGQTCPMCNGPHEASMLVYLYMLSKNNLAQKKIKENIIKRLDNLYDWRLYYLAAMHEILPINSPYFTFLIDLKKPEPGIRSFGSHYYKDEPKRDTRLGAIINLCLKFNIDLTSDRFVHFQGFDPYYDWLMDMKNFNYSNFNPRWITEYATTIYMTKMSQIDTIVQKTIKYLDKNYDYLVIKHLLMIIQKSFEK